MRHVVWIALFVAAGCVGFADGPPPEGAGAFFGGSNDAGEGAGTEGGVGGGLGGGAGGGAGQVQSDGGVDGGASNPCAAFPCASGAHCEPNPTRCVCNAGFVGDGGACVPGDPGVPELRTMAQVCEAWTRGHVTTTNTPFSKTTATCDPGVLAREAIDDTVGRLNMFRWLVGLGPTTDDASENDRAQKCALISAWNPVGQQAHSPPSTATCYSPEGAAAAGSSNIAWGTFGGPAGTVEQWLEDSGNESHMGHRRWLLNPPLGPIGFGWYEGGNNYGRASCMTVFGSSGGGPRPNVWMFPPGGFVPQRVTQMIWTVHGNLGGGIDAGVTRLSDNTAMNVTVDYLTGSYGQHSAIALNRAGWSPAVGETYRVTLTGQSINVTYDVKPVSCP